MSEAVSGRWQTWVSDLKLSITSCRCCSSFVLSLRRPSSFSVQSVSSFWLFSGISCRSPSCAKQIHHHTHSHHAVAHWILGGVLLLLRNINFSVASLQGSTGSIHVSTLRLLTAAKQLFATSSQKQTLSSKVTIKTCTMKQTQATATKNAFSVLTLLAGWQKSIWSTWPHCHPIISASVKSRMVRPSGTGLPTYFWITAVKREMLNVVDSYKDYFSAGRQHLQLYCSVNEMYTCMTTSKLLAVGTFILMTSNRYIHKLPTLHVN